jgi:hypothetical protein
MRSTLLPRFRERTRTVSPVARPDLGPRAVPPTPPTWPAASVRLPPAMRPSPWSKGLGRQTAFSSRPLVGSLPFRPGDSLTVPRMAWSVGFLLFVSSAEATPAARVLTVPPVGLAPTEQASLSWTHWSTLLPHGRRVQHVWLKRRHRVLSLHVARLCCAGLPRRYPWFPCEGTTDIVGD